MASFLVPCWRCSAVLRFLLPQTEPVACGDCVEAIEAAAVVAAEEARNREARAVTIAARAQPQRVAVS